jgi:hypothetical protein
MILPWSIVAEVEGALAPRRRHFRDFRREEVLKVVANGFADAAKLLVG